MPRLVRITSNRPRHHASRRVRRIGDSARRHVMRERQGLDPTDIRILSAVQKHGQLSKTKLAELVNLSATPCWARLTRLRAAGYIRGYHADIALERVVDATRVVVTVSLTHHRKPILTGLRLISGRLTKS